MTKFTATLDVLGDGARRHAALAGEVYTLEQRLRSAWWRLGDGWQSYAREDVETYCAHALNEAGRQSVRQRRLSDALVTAEGQLRDGDGGAAALFGVAPPQEIPDDGSPTFSLLPDLPDHVDGAAPLPGVKVSTEEVTAYESCARETCTAITVQGSGGAVTTGAPGTVTFKLGSNTPNGFELALGAFGGAALGKLTMSLRGMEMSTPSGGVLLEHVLPNGSVLRITSESVSAAARSYTDRTGVAHTATVTGVKYVVALSMLSGWLALSDSITLRQYVWAEKRPAAPALPTPAAVAAPTPEPGDRPWPDLREWLERRRADDRDAPRVPKIPLVPIVPGVTG
jgi:hypothetical protein